MESENIKQLTSNFESYVNLMDNGIEFWFARDLQKLLGYSKWSNFSNVIEKAKISLEGSGSVVSEHFAGVGKTIEMPNQAKKEIEDIMLTRYACYIIAMNGNSIKEEIAFAQQYFAIQTRNFEIIEKRILESERLKARKKLTETEKELSQVIYEQTGNDRNFGLIRSKGDKALFGKTTREMKDKWGVTGTKPLADFMPTILLKAKDFATEITIFNAKDKSMKSEQEISNEHITNNHSVRKTLIERGIIPENLPASEDLKKVERRLKKETNKGLNGGKRFKKK